MLRNVTNQEHNRLICWPVTLHDLSTPLLHKEEPWSNEQAGTYDSHCLQKHVNNDEIKQTPYLHQRRLLNAYDDINDEH